jgi:hypothetical protein
MSGFLKLSFVNESRGNSFTGTELLLWASSVEELLDNPEEDDLAELLLDLVLLLETLVSLSLDCGVTMELDCGVS